MHGHQHIQGSPFSVRVFEPAPPPAPPSVRVYGLDEHKMVGRIANFSSNHNTTVSLLSLSLSLSLCMIVHLAV